MSKFKLAEHINNYYFYFFSWGYYYFSAGNLYYKKIVEKFAGESTTGIFV